MIKIKKRAVLDSPLLNWNQKLINYNLDSASSLYWQEAVVVELGRFPRSFQERELS
jgi:hypothetical protein